jgi:hypothetical protein
MRLFPFAAFREQEEQQANQSLKNYSKALILQKCRRFGRGETQIFGSDFRQLPKAPQSGDGQGRIASRQQHQMHRLRRVSQNLCNQIVDR